MQITVPSGQPKLHQSSPASHNNSWHCCVNNLSDFQRFRLQPDYNECNPVFDAKTSNQTILSGGYPAAKADTIRFGYSFFRPFSSSTASILFDFPRDLAQ